MILPTPQEPSPGPSGSPAVHTLEAQSLHCLQTFSTQDTRGQPFHAQAQEALDVLLRHPSGGLTPRRWAGACCRDTPSCPWDPSGLQELKPPAHPSLGHRLVAGDERGPADSVVSSSLPGRGGPTPGTGWGTAPGDKR